MVGQCGILAQVVDDIPELEVGYHILPQYWGKGYAPEAAKFFINYAFENNLADSIISVIDVGNIKSQRVAEKNGLYREKQTVQMGDDVFVYRILKPLV
jgi:RimJ/RimL family protein N-acetyltransferase